MCYQKSEIDDQGDGGQPPQKKWLSLAQFPDWSQGFSAGTYWPKERLVMDEVDELLRKCNYPQRRRNTDCPWLAVVLLKRFGWCEKRTYSNFKFSSFLRLSICNMGFSYNAGHQQWAAIPSWPCSHLSHQLRSSTALCTVLWCSVGYVYEIHFPLPSFQFWWVYQDVTHHKSRNIWK